MDTKQIIAPDSSAFLASMAALHNWEMKSLPFMQTSTGRHLYYTVAQRAMVEGVELERSLKDLFSSPHFTAKAMRNRMQEMANQGFFTTIHGLSDGRSKHLIPSQKFCDDVHAHVDEAKRLFQENFLLISR